MAVLGALLVVLSGHLIADFYCQTTTVAAKKATSSRYMVQHCLLYAIVMAAFCAIAFVPLDCAVLPEAMVCWATVAVTHALVDLAKASFERRHAFPRFHVFIVDQFAHVLICMGMSLWVLLPYCTETLAVGFPYTVYGYRLALVIIASIALIGRPTMVLIDLLLVHVAGEDQQSSNGQKAGRWIGVLERFIVVMLTLTGNFAAIAFVLAAKSIARFTKFDEQDFAERYLVGTLSSIAIAMASSLLMLHVVL